MAPEDPIYLYLTEWADIRTYDVIKSRTYTSSYMWVSMQIHVTENTPEPMPDARHHGLGEEEKYG